MATRAVVVGAATGLASFGGFVLLNVVAGDLSSDCGLPEPVDFAPLLAVPFLFWIAGFLAGRGLRRGRLAAWLALGALLSFGWSLLALVLTQRLGDGGPVLPGTPCGYRWWDAVLVLIGCALLAAAAATLSRPHVDNAKR